MCHERCNSHPSLTEWQHYYNWERPHSAHNGKTPMEHYFELAEKTPLRIFMKGDHSITSIEIG